MDRHEPSPTQSTPCGDTLTPVTPQTLTRRQYEHLANIKRAAKMHQRQRWVKRNNKARRRY